MLDYTVLDFTELSPEELDEIANSCIETGDAARTIRLVGADENAFTMDIGSHGFLMGTPGRETSFKSEKLARGFGEIMLRSLQPRNFNLAMKELDVWFNLMGVIKEKLECEQ